MLQWLQNWLMTKSKSRSAGLSVAVARMPSLTVTGVILSQPQCIADMMIKCEIPLFYTTTYSFAVCKYYTILYINRELLSSTCGSFAGDTEDTLVQIKNVYYSYFKSV